MLYSKRFIMGIAEIILISQLALSIFTVPSAFALPSSKDKCNCVIFRLDDVQDHWLAEQQSAIMELFVSRNDYLTLGLIMNTFGDDLELIKQIKHGTDAGLFELALHGWEHLDYSSLDEATQTSHFEQANDKFQSMSGQNFDIFLAPYDKFNHDTIKAMTNTEIRIISSDKSDPSQPFISGQGVDEMNSGQTIFHLPLSSTFKYIDNLEEWKELSTEMILDEIDKDIAFRGYAVVTLHPQDLAVQTKGGFDAAIDQRELSNLTLLLDSLSAKKISTSSFSQVVQFDQPKYKDIGNYILIKELSDKQLIPIYVVLFGIVLVIVLAILQRGKRTREGNNPNG